MEKELTLSDYQSLADLRYQIRKFLHFSEQAARDSGVEPHHHQLMLALKGLPKGARPRIGDRREVLLALTPKGEKVLRQLSLHHRRELRSQEPELVAALDRAMRAKKKVGNKERF